MLFRRVVDDQICGQPLYVPNIEIRGGKHNVVFVTTVSNSVYAFGADDPNALLLALEFRQTAELGRWQLRVPGRIGSSLRMSDLDQLFPVLCRVIQNAEFG